MPKTVVTPWATNVSTNASLGVIRVISLMRRLLPVLARWRPGRPFLATRCVFIEFLLDWTLAPQQTLPAPRRTHSHLG